MSKKTKDLARDALKWVRNTTVSVDKIASHFGYTGEGKKKFISIAQDMRKEQWNKLIAMSPEEKIKWSRKNW